MINDISIATITWARNEEEEKLLRAALTVLAGFGLPTFITDGGSDREFIEFLQSFPNFNVLEAKEKGLWAQAKNSLLAAGETGSKFILYSEPDKFIFFKEHLKLMLEQLTLNDDDGILLASRTAAGFSSFPAFQQMCETTINNCCSETTGEKFDYTYGPLFLNAKLVSYVDLIKEDIGWGWRPYMFGIAPRLGLKVKSYESDFYCPEDQQQDDTKERLYRMKQLQENIRGVTLAASVPITP